MGRSFGLGLGVLVGLVLVGVLVELRVGVQRHYALAGLPGFTLPGDTGYSPLWLVAVYDNADFPSVHDRATAQKAKVLALGAATVNCPIVFVTP